MEINADQLFENAIRDAIAAGVKAQFTGYNSPLDSLLKQAVNTHSAAFRELLESAIGSCVSDSGFRDEIAQATRHSLARLLVQRFGGELEKQVNVLKSDPTTRARIVLAIEGIVKSQSH